MTKRLVGAARVQEGSDPVLDLKPGRGRFPIVGIGASAGGLDALGKLLDALPGDSGMAFIVIQHLDPTHDSTMASLLAGRTKMTVLQAVDRMRLEGDHVYVIHPGVNLSIRDGAIRLAEMPPRQGPRRPIDIFLQSLAKECGKRAIGAILSGTGDDGSRGIQAIRENGGLVIAQDPDEAGFDGMSRNAILTGVVDLVLPVAEMAAALVKYGKQPYLRTTPTDPTADERPAAGFNEIIDLLRQKTAHDFTLYKPERCRGGSSGGWRFGSAGRRELFDAPARRSGRNRPARQGHAHPRHPFLSRPQGIRDIGGKVFPSWCDATPTTARCASGCRAAAPGRRPIRSPCCSSRRSPRPSATSNCRSSPPTSTRARSALPVPASTGNRSKPTWLPRGSPGSSSRRSGATGLCVNCANGGLHRAESAGPCAILAPRLGLLPQPVDLSASRGAGAGHFPVSFRAPRGRHPAARQLRDGRPARHPVRADLQAAADLSACRPRPVDRGRGCCRGDRGQAGGFAARGGAGAASLGDLAAQLLATAYVPASVLVNHKHECLSVFGATDRYLQATAGGPNRDVTAMAHEGLGAKLEAALQRPPPTGRRRRWSPPR